MARDGIGLAAAALLERPVLGGGARQHQEVGDAPQVIGTACALLALPGTAIAQQQIAIRGGTLID